MKRLLLKQMTAVILAGAAVFTASPSHAAPDYVAHEWGTFTSIQGADGSLVDWNGVTTVELPPFVYNSTRPGLGRKMNIGGLASSLSKISFSALQRMETPVIYFYSKESFRADVTVQFPKGYITEWFPQARDIGPSTYGTNSTSYTPDVASNGDQASSIMPLAEQSAERRVTNSLIHWSNFEVIPQKQESSLADKLPTSYPANHYFAARETDSALIRVPSMEQYGTSAEVEKFLFYRGIGNFHTPLKVSVNAEDEITVTNASDTPLKRLFALAVRGEHAMFVPIDPLDPGQIHQFRMNLQGDGLSVAEVENQLSLRVAEALVAEGLYPAEANAMVETWRDAWFEDDGVRILYVLPRAWTDEILPISLEPKPRELVRVMVGRAELITRDMEDRILDCVTLFRKQGAQPDVLGQFQALKLGRFALAAMRIVADRLKDQSFYNDGIALIKASEAPEAATSTASITPQATRPLPGHGG